MSTPTTDLSLTALQLKISEAAKVLESIPGLFEQEYEDEEGNVFLASEEHIWSRLAMLGIYKTDDSHEMLISDDCTEGDARRCFCENGEPNIPVTRFKRIWRILKGSSPEINTEEKPSTTTSEISVLVDSMKPIGQWKDERLLAEYGPECSSDIEEELKRRAKGRRFVIFYDEMNHIIDQENTLKFLRTARRIDTPETYVADGKMVRLYQAGQFPSLVYNTCPLHPSQILMDGYCDQCGSNWSFVDEDALVFVRVMVEEGEEPTSNFEIRHLIEDAHGGLDSLLTAYPKVGIIFNERKTEERLPSLKLRHSSNSAKPADPFHATGNKKRF